MRNYQTFNLHEINNSPRGVYDLADGLLPEMALAMGYDGLGDQPATAALQDFIRQIAPAKFLQDNISLVRERLDTNADAETIAGDWADRSGSLSATRRSFSSSDTSQDSIPKNTDAFVIFNTVVGRWQERRINEIVSLKDNGQKLIEAVILAGNRVMAETEHPEVSKIAAKHGTLPTEARFAEEYTKPTLRYKTGLEANVIAVESSNGDEIFTEGLRRKSDLLGFLVIAVGNAPSTIQVAGQLRKAAQGISPDFDSTGSQLYMSGDSIPVARNGEGPTTHQNPFTALGQIARNALILHEQSHRLGNLLDGPI